MERGGKPENDFDYGCACYESALKAFESLCNDGHSGYSIHVTKYILNRLIDGKPLTPIEDTDDVWSTVTDRRDGCISYQNTRMSSLFKVVDENTGTVKYHDNDRFVAVDVSNKSTWHSGLVTAIGSEMYPVTMPYMPESKRYEVYFEELLTDPKNGDFDTEAVLYIITPTGEKKEINRYFREPNDGEQTTYKGWVEIGYDEYAERKLLDKLRKEKQDQETV